MTGKNDSNTAQADETSEEAVSGAQAEVQRLVIDAVGKALEPIIAATKRPFFITEAAALKLQLAFDEIVEDCIDDDGEVDTELIEEKQEIIDALYRLAGK